MSLSAVASFATFAKSELETHYLSKYTKQWKRRNYTLRLCNFT
ncbi:hypothetical protein EV202_10723 [Bacteroides heparinolyticus]|uniref:Uncharacterized protein n=1 Tax=Prevotella heparinolytica TaxID=28113 RepID=A0A449I7C9_9BACE|nr:hypothetical protein EV202_10723 [Bacteroides heparinolyticus]VFB15343.1 Uncharacterised protein [Bacteroides heparinolyticus]